MLNLNTPYWNNNLLGVALGAIRAVSTTGQVLAATLIIWLFAGLISKKIKK